MRTQYLEIYRESVEAAIATAKSPVPNDVRTLLLDDYFHGPTLPRIDLLADPHTSNTYREIGDRARRLYSADPAIWPHPPEVTVLVDMDGVLVDYDSHALSLAQDKDPAFPTPPLYLDKRLEIQNVVTSTQLQIARDVQCGQYFLRDLPLMPNAQAGLRRIKEAELYPRICSSPMASNLWCVAEKLISLEQHFGPEVAEAAVISRNKHLIPGSVLIDDRPELHGSNEATWTHVVYDRPYNQQSTAPQRLHGWLDPNLVKILRNTSGIDT